jgi:glycine cleavage system regulatory protein
MKTALVLTVIGPDRPGLVEALAATVAEHGGNWEQSRMARLGGQFAGILRVQLPDARVAALRTSLEGLGARGLRVVADVVDQGADSGLGYRPFRLEIVGNDRAGIVRDVSRALAEQHVNVEEIETSCESAAMSGAPLFRAVALLNVPEGVAIDKLRKRLEGIADDLMVDVKLVDPAR